MPPPSSFSSSFGLLLLFLTLVAAFAEADARRGGSRISKDFLKTPSQRRDAATKDSRHGKLFSLFNIVTFENAPCASASTLSGDQRRNGTCMASSECDDASGTASGNCAAGFGVCCLFILDGSGSTTITQNCTYIQNPSFPSVYSSTSAQSFTVNRCSNDVCFLRLDFETFTIIGSADTLETNGGNCGSDTFTVTTTNPNSVSIPTICGQNTGQHIYVDIGNQGSDTATLAFSFTGSSTVRTWEIKVTQVECTSMVAPPDGCVQYHTGLTGRFTSFNFLATGETHLASQEYSVCIRQEQGYCCVLYSVCSDANSFTLFQGNGMGGAAIVTAQIDSQCAEDYVVIDGSTGAATCDNTGNAVTFNRYCGSSFNANNLATTSVPVCDCTQPFTVGIVTDTTDNGGGISNTISTDRGVCLEYMQVLCNS